MAQAPDPDCTWLERELADIEAKSAKLPWHREAGTRWQVGERVDVEWSDELGAVPRVDLHGLDQRLTREVVGRVLAGRAQLRAPAVRFVTGSGNHSEDGRGVLGEVVERCVGEARGVSLHPTGNLPWRDVVLGEGAPEVVAARRARPPRPEPGLVERLLAGIMGALVGALVGAVASVFGAAFGAPGRAFARWLRGRRTRGRGTRRRR